MPISIKHAVPSGIAALTGLLSGQGRSAVRETETRNQAQRLLSQFTQRNLEQDLSLRSRESSQAQSLSTQRFSQVANIRAQRERQVSSLQAQRQNTQQQIQASAKRQSQAADDAYKRTALSAGLQSELQEQAYDQRIQAMEEAARIQAQRTKLQYSMETKREMAEDNAARNFVTNSDDFSPEMKQQFFDQLDRKKYNLDKVPAGEEAQYEDGKGPKDTWPGPDGSIWGWDANGIPDVKVKYSDTKAGKDADAAAKQRLEEIKVIQKESDYRRERIEAEQERVFTMMQSTDEDNKPVSRESALRKSREAFGDPTQLPDRTGPSVAASFAASGSQAATQVQAAPAVQAATTVDAEWYLKGDWREHPMITSNNVRVHDTDLLYSPEIGSLRALTRHQERMWRGKKLTSRQKEELAIAKEKIQRAERERFKNIGVQ